MIIWLFCVLAVLFVVSNVTPQKINGHVIVSSALNPLAQIPGAVVLSSGLIEKEVLEIIAASLNFTYEVRRPRDVLGVGIFTNENGTGALGQLIRRECDVFVTGGEMTFDKLPYFDATFFLFFDTVKILIPYPVPNRNLDALTAVYSTKVWIIIFVFFVIVGGFMGYLSRSRDVSSIILIVGLITMQKGYVRYRNLPSRFLWLPFAIAMVILINVYTGTLISKLSAPSYRFLANSIDDVAKNNKIRPHLFVNSPVDEYIHNSELPVFKSLRIRLDNEPSLTVPLGSDVVKLLLGNDRNVFILTERIGNAVIVADRKSSGHCRFTFAKIPVNTRRTAWFLQKNSPLTKLFDKKIHQLHQSGLLMYMLRKYVPDIRQCCVSEKPVAAKLQKLRLDQLTDCFTLLYIGWVLSFSVFIASWFYKYFRLKFLG